MRAQPAEARGAVHPWGPVHWTGGRRGAGVDRAQPPTLLCGLGTDPEVAQAGAEWQRGLSALLAGNLRLGQARVDTGSPRGAVPGIRAGDA